MTATITAITAGNTAFATAIVAVAKNEAAFQFSNTESKGLRDAANVSKIVAYSHLIEIIIEDKIRKGSKKAGELRASLIAAGVSEACAKRYCEIGQAASKLPLIKTAFGSRAGIFQVLEENDIRTEAALKNVCFPPVEKSTVEKLIDLAKSGSDDDDAAVQALLDAAATINPGVRDVADTLVAALAA
jgi:ribosomal protein L17